MTLFLVGIYKDEPWEVVGIFDSEARALSECISECHFIGPLRLNEACQAIEGVLWEGCHYPLGEEAA